MHPNDLYLVAPPFIAHYAANPFVTSLCLKYNLFLQNLKIVLFLKNKLHGKTS